MGSGDRFSITWMHFGHWCLGLSYVPNFPHRHSFYINLLKIQIYIAFGKGYDER